MSETIRSVLVGHEPGDGKLLFTLREPSGGARVVCLQARMKSREVVSRTCPPITPRRGPEGLTGKNEDGANGDDYRAQALDDEQLRMK
jgi:hypothetical protein